MRAQLPPAVHPLMSETKTIVHPVPVYPDKQSAGVLLDLSQFLLPCPPGRPHGQSGWSSTGMLDLHALPEQHLREEMSNNDFDVFLEQRMAGLIYTYDVSSII
jgi:hypothetical protein